MEPKSLAELIVEAKRTADRQEYQEIKAKIAEKEIEEQLAENAKRLEAEAREQAEFEAEKEAHLAQIEDLEIKKRFLANNERSMIESMITGLSLTKIQIETFAQAKKLAKGLNDVREIYGTPLQTVDEIDVFGADLRWKNVASGLLERVADLLHWNQHHPDHFRTVTPENVKMHPTKWGEPQMDDEPPGADDIPEVDQGFFDSQELEL